MKSTLVREPSKAHAANPDALLPASSACFKVPIIVKHKTGPARQLSTTIMKEETCEGFHWPGVFVFVSQLNSDGDKVFSVTDNDFTS